VGSLLVFLRDVDKSLAALRLELDALPGSPGEARGG
jgi:hypothetical protein